MSDQSDVEQRKSAMLTPEQMRTAVPKIKQLINELGEIDVSKTKERGEERFELLEEKIDSTLAAIFGDDTVEYDRFRIESLDTAKIHMMYEIPLYEVKEGYVRGIEQAISKLRAVIELFGEKMLASGDSLTTRRFRAFAERNFHPLIAEAVAEPFTAGKCVGAVKLGCNALEKQLREACGNGELSGNKLVYYAFDTDEPVLRYNEMQTAAQRDEQQGMLLLFAGAMMTADNRNARARIGADPERTLEFLSLLSFLAKSLDSINASQRSIYRTR